MKSSTSKFSFLKEFIVSVTSRFKHLMDTFKIDSELVKYKWSLKHWIRIKWFIAFTQFKAVGSKIRVSESTGVYIMFFSKSSMIFSLCLGLYKVINFFVAQSWTITNLRMDETLFNLTSTIALVLAFSNIALSVSI